MHANNSLMLAAVEEEIFTDDDDYNQAIANFASHGLLWPPKLPFGQQLLQAGLISADQLQVALHEQNRQPQRAMIGLTLVRLSFITEEDLACELAIRAESDTIDVSTANPDPALLQRLPRQVAAMRLILPLEMDDGLLRLAVADPFDLPAFDEIKRHFRDASQIVSLIAGASAMASAISRCYGLSSPVDGILREIEGRSLPHGNASRDIDAHHPVVRMVDALMEDAARAGASDIHLEPEDTFVRVRHRIDGTLSEARTLHLSHWSALSHRIKIMGGMDISDTRGIQDGRFSITVDGREIDCRAAVMPTVNGENIVVRLLDNRRALLSLDELGLSAHCVAALLQAIAKPHGVTLVTGPTGSGKTTTLHALLRRLSSLEVKIATLEEPVEYQPGLLRQTAVQEEHGLGFAAGVRGVLRTDPDIILIGEVRDPDTAQMALRAAMTGHKVFSTLHCPDAVGALPRLHDLGISPRTLSGNLSAVTAQRLVRRLCPDCANHRRATSDECTILRCDAAPPPLLAIASVGADCPSCSGSGYRGRVAVAEVMRITPEIDELITACASRAAILTAARANGFRDMAEDGLARVRMGEIALADLQKTVALG